MPLFPNIQQKFHSKVGSSKKLAFILLSSLFIGSALMPSSLGAMEQSKAQSKNNVENPNETPSRIGAFTLPKSNNRFWFYMDNLELQLKGLSKNEQHDSSESSTIKALLDEAKEVKKSRVTYREVRDYLEVNHKVLSHLGVVDPHNNGFKGK